MLQIDLKGKVAFVAGVGDERGFGWACAKALWQAGATVCVGTWPPMYKIFTGLLESGKLDEARRTPDGSLFEIAKIYPLDAVFDIPADVPAEIQENKRYKELSGYTISEVVSQLHKDFTSLDILVHSLANAKEIQKGLLQTSRQGYLDAISASTYSFVSLLKYFVPIMPQDGAALTLTYIASQATIPGYGGGMSSAKAALESDVRTLAYEAGRQYGIRVNAISAGVWGSRAAKAIGFVDQMVAYTEANAPLARSIQPQDVGHTAAFLLSPLARAITGETLFVDSGMHSMGLALDSKSLD